MVSIITNCYNGEKYLEETIQSVLSQTYTDWEYLLFDNNSTDRSSEIFLSHKDPRFKYFKNELTVPLGHGRNDAVNMVVGDYICFIDSDDLWLPDNLSKQVDVMEKNPDVGLVYSDYQPFGVDNTYRKTSRKGFRTTSEILDNYDLGLSSTMFRRSLLKNKGLSINKKYQIIADFDFFVRISRVSKCYHIKEDLVRYRTHNSNLSNKTEYTIDELQDFYYKLSNDMTSEEINECKSGLRKIIDKIWYLSYFVNLKERKYRKLFTCIIRINSLKLKLSCIKRTLTNF
jgi:glycosyltransferase involved in cell wall biosynthesis